MGGYNQELEKKCLNEQVFQIFHKIRYRQKIVFKILTDIIIPLVHLLPPRFVLQFQAPPANEHGQVRGDIMDMLGVNGIRLFKFP